ncbi:MAG: 3-dehydroquinate dehydratase [Sphingobacteriales bacterium]|nr:3-dehydroquinate dehydratase [Sphingobacteriales bacterium]
MNIFIINGPNLNLLGTRQPDIYGNRNFSDYLEELRKKYPDTEINYFQSNHAGEIIDKLHEIAFTTDGIILNPAAYTHSSLAIADAVAAIRKPVVEVHLTNIYARDNIRHQSMVSRYAKGVISGFGLDVYELALNALLKLLNKAD